MELCRRGTVILDGAEKKVEMLLGARGGAPRIDPLRDARRAEPTRSRPTA